MELSFTPSGIDFAYRRGIFPMMDHITNELFWCCPDPRAILPLERFHTSRSLAKTIRSGIFQVSFNTAFEAVMRGCADRKDGTWISEEFIRVYSELHSMGRAHSVEVWNQDGGLAGGTYGVSVGGAFMAESMFHRDTDASKVALSALVSRLIQCGFVLLDVQYLTSHLASLGAVEIPHYVYNTLLLRAQAINPRYFAHP